MNAARRLRLKLIDMIGGLSIYEVLKTFRKHQYLPVKELEKIRQEKLAHLLFVARKSTTHYAKYDADNFEALPELPKAIVIRDPSSFLSSSYRGKLIKKSTSGSTGTPFVYHTSANAQSHLWAGLILSWESAGYCFADKVAFLAGSALIKRSWKHALFYKLMNIDLYPAAVMSDQVIVSYITKMEQKKTRLLYGYAMAINTIADYIIKTGIAPPEGLVAIVCTAEMLTEKVRANIEKAFGIKVFNQYGCSEGGVTAFECEQHQLHLISSRSVFEINKEGVLISTDLANEAYIFIKYDTGDLVEFSEGGCSCGRSYPVIKKIIGRTADVIIDRKNKRIHNSYFNFLFKNDKAIKQYQVLFDERSIKINLRVGNDFSAKNFLHYITTIKNNFDFEEYDIQLNEQFDMRSNLKHTFIIDKRKQQVAG